jgi:hypothetical protein
VIEVKPVTLPSEVGDEDGMLLFHDGRLIAVLSCLGELHDDLAGRWFVEARFGSPAPGLPETFVSLEEAQSRLVGPGATGAKQ